MSQRAYGRQGTRVEKTKDKEPEKEGKKHTRLKEGRRDGRHTDRKDREETEIEAATINDPLRVILLLQA